MERRFFFVYFQGDQMMGFVVVDKDNFPLLGFAYDTKKTVI